MIKKKISALLLILLSIETLLLSQNLIVNPSFEQSDECPETFSITYKQALLFGWTSPTAGTPDYFNKCSKGTVGVPENWVGYCEPSDGQAYMGLYLYKEPRYREFIQGKLRTPLVAGNSYRLSFYVSHALNSAYFMRSIGCLFSRSQVSNYFESGYSFSVSEVKRHKKGKANSHDQTPTDLDPLNIKTDVGQYFKFQIKPEVEEWQLITLDFLAEDEFVNFIIGNFDEQQDIQTINNESKYSDGTMLAGSAYALIDDFSLIPLAEVAIDTLKISVPFIIGDVNFEFSSAELKASAMELLDSVHHSILNSSKINVLISGHTDDIGSDFYNDQLSRLRAESVAAYLMKIGLDPERITTIGQGESEPIKENDSEENRSINRRVEIQFLK